MKKNVLMIDCPICNKQHEVLLLSRKAASVIKEKSVEFMEKYCRCPDTAGDNEFVPVKLMDENLLKARDAYRKDSSLLTSQDIKKIREKYHLTQSEFSRMLGFGDTTVTRYESKMIQDYTYDHIMRMADENPLFAYESLQRNKKRFEPENHELIKKSIQNEIDKGDLSFFKKQEVYYRYMKYSKPGLLNGNKLIDIDKIEDVISYMAYHVTNLFKVKLMKLLWYCDFIFFRKYRVSITGLVYQHMLYGALPIAYDEIVGLKNIEIKEVLMGTDIGYLIKSKKSINSIRLSKNEKMVIDLVIDYFKNMDTSEIIAMMHKEEAYLKTKSNEIISYEYSRCSGLSII
ncbi:MAG: DUF4065 domain-containing protein [Clostridia bacterium]|nr:DUF4065 domain-containing protein [Clostridia bacterium]